MNERAILDPVIRVYNDLVILRKLQNTSQHVLIKK
jgi:hypothetical protein